MKLWRISQEVNNGYDTYSDAVVAAETEDEARLIHPGGCYKWDGKWVATRRDGSTFDEGHYGTWAHPEQVAVEFIGTASQNLKEPGVVCASFHAG